MKPAPSETAELLHRVRQQLILAQVRIMELEDVRDELGPRLAETDKLLASAQTLADQKTGEATHLARTLSDLQAQYEHMRHMQHITSEALNDSRCELADVATNLTAAITRLAATEQRAGQLQKEVGLLTNETGQLNARIGQLGRELVELKTTAASRLARINELDAEMRALKISRSWRWTAWLRAIERKFGRR